jgi:hypothetical protein
MSAVGLLNGQEVIYNYFMVSCLDGLYQTRGNVARVKKSGLFLRTFLNSSNIPKCLDQAIQTRKS